MTRIIYLCIKDFCDKSTSTFTSCCICNLKGIKKNHGVYRRRKSCQATYFCGGNSQRRLREWHKGKEREKEQFESKTLMGLTSETRCVSSGIKKLHNYSTKPQLGRFKNASLSFYFESGLKIWKSGGKVIHWELLWDNGGEAAIVRLSTVRRPKGEVRSWNSILAFIRRFQRKSSIEVYSSIEFPSLSTAM